MNLSQSSSSLYSDCFKELPGAGLLFKLFGGDEVLRARAIRFCCISSASSCQDCNIAALVWISKSAFLIQNLLQFHGRHHCNMEKLT